MRIVVLGAGAIGGLFGARLSARGEEVLLVARPAVVAAVRSHGMIVEGNDPVVARPEAAEGVGPGTLADVVLVTAKSFDLAQLLGGLGRSVPPSPTVLLGNGLGIEATAVEALRRSGWAEAERWVVRAVHTVPARMLAPGRVEATGSGEVTLPAAGSAGPAEGALAPARQALERTGYPVRSSRSFDRELWRKLVVNAAINPTTALRAVPNGALASGPAHEQALRLLEEAVAVARASGIQLDVAEAKEDLARVVAATAANRSSMLQDLERGRPTEVEAISGELLRRGAAAGIDLPATSSVVRELLLRTGAPTGHGS